MNMMNRLVNSRCVSCWKYLRRFVTQNNNSSFLCVNRNFILAIRSTHETSVPFKAEENEYFHSFLAKNKKYAETIAFLDYTPIMELPTDIESVLQQNFENEPLIKLTTYLHGALLHSHNFPTILEDPNFKRLCDTLISKINTIHDDHIVHLFKILVLWKEKYRSNLFYNVCKGIDGACLSRYRIWGHSKCLLIMDYFYRLQVLKFSQFVWNCMNRLWRNPDRLTPNQVIHALFLVNAHRIWHPSVHLYNLECYLHQNIYELSVEECAIAALAFFKTQTKIKNLELLALMYQKLEYRLSTIDSIPLCSLLKIFNYTPNMKFVDKQISLQKRLVNLVDKHSYFCCTHIVLLGHSLHLRNTQLLDKVADRFVNEISTIRLKDIERTILAFQTFNYSSQGKPNPYELALSELIKRTEEGSSFPIAFYSSINYLCLSGYYNFDLIDKVLSEDFLKKAFKLKNLVKFTCPLSLLVINNCVQIDCPEYTGNLLNPTLVESTSKFYSRLLPKPSTAYANTMYRAKLLLEEILGGPDFIHLSFVLPHFSRPDLLFRFVDGKVAKLPENILSKKYSGVELPKEPGDWCVLTFFGYNTLIYGTDEPLGITKAKLRHLNKLGYKVLYLREKEIMGVSKEEQIEYLRQLIEESKIKQVQ